VTAEERDILRDLLRVATGELPHDFMGACPDRPDEYVGRDHRCAACRAILRYEAEIGGTP
jgi:hypothetical protein